MRPFGFAKHQEHQTLLPKFKALLRNETGAILETIQATSFIGMSTVCGSKRVFIKLSFLPMTISRIQYIISNGSKLLQPFLIWVGEEILNSRFII